MEKFEPNFLDKPELEPFNGCLVIFNIGNHNYDNIGMTWFFGGLLTEAVANAHASGWLVYYVFDSKHGSSVPPDFLDNVADQDFVGLSKKVLGTELIDFSLLPSKRMQQFKQIIGSISSQQGIKILGSSAVVTGLCGFEGDEVFLPPTEVK
jgi:hypothetical protein